MSERTLFTGSVDVFTFKEGLLSRVAHDLCLHLDEHEVEMRGDAVEARLMLASLRVAHALRDGKPDSEALSSKDRAKIQQNVQEQVLHVARNPEALFSGRVERSQSTQRLVGQLRLHGQEHPLEVLVEESDGRLRGEVELVPSRWGIAPFKAMLGAIKLQDRVLVRFSLSSS